MKTNNKTLSETRVDRIREQGHFLKSDSQICELATGNRFAYRACTTILIAGVAFASIPILVAINVIAFFGAILPNHPFDYIYNGLLSKRMGKPNVQPRPAQMKFACSIATLWIAGTIYFFSTEMMIAGYLSGTIMIVIAGLVSTIDLCIPSVIYNALFLRGEKSQTANS